MRNFLRRAVMPLALLLAFGAFGAGDAAAQTGTVTGQVTDQTSGQPLAGVQISLVGTTRGTITNQEGRFLLSNVQAGERTLRAVLIGYAQQTRTVSVPSGGTVVEDIAMSQSAVQLDALVVNVVTGRESRQRELSTNVSTIQVDEVQLAPITTFSDLLKGRTEGVMLQEINGTTGASQRIRIRGANSLSLDNEPLIYVDGVRFSNSKGLSAGFTGGQEPSRLNDINPNDIANVEIVKGPAATALYGTEAANGVILITTKRGQAGDAQWSAYVETAMIRDNNDWLDNIASFTVLDASQPILRSSPSALPNPAFGFVCPNLLAAFGPGVCTQDETRRSNFMKDDRIGFIDDGDRQRYGLSVAGGNEGLTYFVSGELQQEGGLMPNNDMDRTNLRANVTAQVTDELQIQVSTSYTDSELTLPNNDNSIFSPIINAITGTAVFVPNPADPNEVSRANFPIFGQAPRDVFATTSHQIVDRLILGGTATWTPTDWLSGNLNTGLDFFSREDNVTIQPNTVPISFSFARGFRNAAQSKNWIYTVNGSLSGSANLTDELTSTTTLGGSYEQSRFENVFCGAVGIVAGSNSCGAGSQLFSADEAFSEVITIGGFAQQEFGWRDRVFINASLRFDDDSAFGEGADLAFYPAGGISWVVGEEDWFPEWSWLSEFRVRGAAGTSGLRPGFRTANTFFAPVAVSVNGGEQAAVTISNTGNANLEPERVTEFEAGFEAGLFNDRLGIDFSWYRRESEDALISRQQPNSLGATLTRIDNLGKVRNSGTELAIRTTPIDFDNVRLDLRFNNTTLDNEVVDLGVDDQGDPIGDIIVNRGEQRHREGFSAGAFFERRITFNDADGDGLIDCPTPVFGAAGGCEVSVEDTVSFIGPQLPTNQQSLSFDLTLFRYLTVSSLFERRAGHFQLNNTEAFRCDLGGLFALFNRMTGCAASGDPNASLEEQARYVADSFLGTPFGYIEEADFIKWREASVTLQMPDSWADKVPQLRDARFTFAGRNLETWTDYTGIDPEINETGGNTNFTQGEFNTFPAPRVWSFRLDVRF